MADLLPIRTSRPCDKLSALTARSLAARSLVIHSATTWERGRVNGQFRAAGDESPCAPERGLAQENYSLKQGLTQNA